jgi:hypothetical protein
MRIYFQFKLAALAICMSLFALHVVAQQESVAKKDTEKAAVTKTAPAKTNSTNSAESRLDANKTPANKKMVQDATISLQTTITGNQEQPKVLYILPWQSPQTESVDFEPLDNQQKAVFNHVERDELRRELETADAIKD